MASVACEQTGEGRSVNNGTDCRSSKTTVNLIIVKLSGYRLLNKYGRELSKCYSTEKRLFEEGTGRFLPREIIRSQKTNSKNEKNSKRNDKIYFVLNKSTPAKTVWTFSNLRYGHQLTIEIKKLLNI